MDHVATGAAISAIASPWWLTILHTVSSGAASILPVMGVILLSLQLYDRVSRKRKQNIEN